jgi:hypothetical protein
VNWSVSVMMLPTILYMFENLITQVRLTYLANINSETDHFTAIVPPSVKN